MLQAALSDGPSFDPFAFEEDGLAPAEVDVRRIQLAVRGGSTLDRVRLFADVIVPPDLLERRLLLLC